VQSATHQKRVGIVVPHTHWDRAWYLPFAAYRLRLVEMLEDLLAWLDAGTVPVFVLDGQTVLLEDVFAVRPSLRSRVERFVREKKLIIGPWYTMPDLFLARPESLIRNLQRGLQMAEELGGGSRVGYVPDSFGHFAQLPQILTGFGISSFLFMRGMPVALRDAGGAFFTWRAPAGHEVRAVYLREGYFPLGALGQESFHGRYDGLSAQHALASKRLSDTLVRLEEVQQETVFVLPAGGDHLPARADIADVVEHLNRAQEHIHLRFGSFENFLSAVPKASFARHVHEGDLLGQADHPLLRNVLSSRVDLKILNHNLQTALAGVVEPLLTWSVLAGLPVVHPALVQNVWDLLLKNHAHDDICGCSVDDVHLDDVQRFQEALAAVQEIISRQLEHAVQKLWGSAGQTRSARVFVFNPHPWPVVRKCRARILLPDEGGEFSPPSPARVLNAHNASGHSVSVTVLSTRCKDIRNHYLETTWGRSYEVVFELPLPACGFDLVTIEESTTALPLPLVSQSLLAQDGDDSSGEWTFLPQEVMNFVSREIAQGVPRELLHGFSFELDVDAGDGYSFGPQPEIPPRKAHLVSARRDPQQAEVFHLEFELEGHSGLEREKLGGSSLDDALGPNVKMRIFVEALSRAAGIWELNLSYTNVFKDSRLRMLFAQPTGVERIHSDAQAMWQEHSADVAATEIWDGPLAEPRYPGEKGYAVHHTNNGVVCEGAFGVSFCGGAGLHEFEKINTGAGLNMALTLHRAVGSLSVRGGRIRSCQAGPQRATPDAQLQKHLQHRIAFGLLPEGGCVAGMRALKEILEPTWVQEVPIVPTALSAKKMRPVSLLSAEKVPLQIMALKPLDVERGCVLRMLNPTESHVSATLDLPVLSGSAQEMRLDDETPLADEPTPFFEGMLEVAFKPYEIKTWKIRAGK
jgi:mannosylglycerate hydrolase